MVDNLRPPDKKDAATGTPPPKKDAKPLTSAERTARLADSSAITLTQEGDPLDPWWSEKTEAITNVDESVIETADEPAPTAIQPTTPVTYTDSQVAHDWLKWEEDSRFSRDSVVLKAGGADATFISGTVFAKESASGKWVAVAPGGSGGAESAAGILVMTTKVPTGVDITAAMLVRDALVVRSLLIFPVGATAPQIDTAISQLEAKGIIARQGA